MNYIVNMQVGYYDDDDTYHGPFESNAAVDAQTLEDALQLAHDVLRARKCELSEPENMTDGVVLSVRDNTGKLLFDHALSVLKEEAGRAGTEEEAKLNVLARLR